MLTQVAARGGAKEARDSEKERDAGLWGAEGRVDALTGGLKKKVHGKVGLFKEGVGGGEGGEGCVC